MNVVDEIRNIVANHREFPSIDDAIRTLLPTSTDNSRERIYEDYVIQISDIAWINKHADNLRWMRELEIAAAPEVLAMLPFDSSCVLVGRYWACQGEKLLEIPWNSNLKFKRTAARQFRHEMEVLFDHDRVHAWAHRSYSYWRVAEDAGTIVMTDWPALVTPERLDYLEKGEFLAAIDRLLAQRLEAG